MSNRSRRDAAARTEARRRARMSAQGLEPDDSMTDDAVEPARRGSAPAGGFVQRLFPPAAPLPGRADPLATFRYEGPLRPVVETLYLLRRNPIAWLATGLLFGLSYLAMFRAGNQVVYMVASILSFVALIAAGWFGWQRPWAFGLLAAIFGYVAFVLIALATGFVDAPSEEFTPAAIAQGLAVTAVLQAVIGVVAGFYGGYLRRRMAEPRPGATSRRRR